jgi:hypothetical protein
VGAYEYIGSGTSAPVISGLFTSGISTNSAVINWSTDQPSSSYVQYGLTSYTNTTATDPTLVNIHSVTLSGLSASTLYHFRSASTNSKGQTTFSPDSTFTTAPAGGGGGSNSATFVRADTATQGSWKGVYGAQGHNVFDDTVSYPSYVSVTPAGQSDYIWASSTSDVRGLQKALSSTDRIAATWYSYGSFTIDLNFNDGAQHQLAVYCLDWDAGGARAQTLSILDGTTNAVLNSQSVGSFQNGKYVVWNLTGHVILKVTNAGGVNAVISGLFFN